MSKSRKKTFHVLIAGWGGMAQKHIQALRDLNIPCRFVSLKEADFKNETYDFAIIASPTVFHIRQSTLLARHGIPLMIEKPLSSHTQGLKQLLTLVRKKKLLTYVCCQLRFDPLLIKTKSQLQKKTPHRIRIYCHSYLPHWRPGRDFKKIYSAHKTLGGGVAYDLIHEFDYLYWWLGKPKKVMGFRGKLSKLPIDTDDTCSAVCAYPKTLVEISLGYADKKPARGFEIFYEDHIIRGDLLKIKNTSLLKEQMAHFLDCLKNKKNSLNPISQASDVLHMVQQLEVV